MINTIYFTNRTKLIIPTNAKRMNKKIKLFAKRIPPFFFFNFAYQPPHH